MGVSALTRYVCQFSCGAASAVAAKLILAEQDAAQVVIVNSFIVEEDSDNRRFLADCEKWFGHPITVLRDEKYSASTDQVWIKRKYMKGLHGAPCSKQLKRRVLDGWREPDDVMVLGYTAEESDRFNGFIDANNDLRAIAPLIDKGLTKADCLAMVERAGIQLPLMYRAGFHNANCVGCPKGGEGYWNKIRAFRPERFEAVAAIQDTIGPGSFFFRNRATGERFGLRQLDPSAGRHDEPEISCSFFCEMAEQDIRG
jgi:hypothetical protein